MRCETRKHRTLTGTQSLADLRDTREGEGDINKKKGKRIPSRCEAKMYARTGRMFTLKNEVRFSAMRVNYYLCRHRVSIYSAAGVVSMR